MDASPDALAINRERVTRPDVSCVVADLFERTTAGSYDVVFFSFWLSHIPRPRFGAFWSVVR